MLQCAFSQITFNFGPELGMAFSRIPKYDKYSVAKNNESVKESTFPVISPLVGLHLQMVIKKNFLFTTGVQYEMTGQRYKFDGNGIDSSYNNASFKTEIIQKQSFQKVCFLLSLGYTFKIYKYHISIYGGWRPDYFFSGRYDSTVNVSSSAANLDHKYEEKFNPLTECYNPVKNINHQYYYGISISKKHFEFAINHCVGFKLNYYKDKLATSSIFFKNDDFTISVRYRFFALRKDKVKCNVFN